MREKVVAIVITKWMFRYHFPSQYVIGIGQICFISQFKINSLCILTRITKLLLSLKKKNYYSTGFKKKI